MNSLLNHKISTLSSIRSFIFFSYDFKLLLIITGLMLSIPKLPRFDEVFKEKTTPITGFPEVIVNKSEPTNYTRNLWFYTERKHSVGHRNMTDFIENSSKKSSSNQIFYTFVGIMVIIDVMWFLHRMVNIMRTTRLLLYGYPVYVDCREGKGLHFIKIKQVSISFCRFCEQVKYFKKINTLVCRTYRFFLIYQGLFYLPFKFLVQMKSFH